MAGLPAWDPKRGAATELAPDDLHRLYAKGAVQLVKDAVYPMVNAAGEVRDVSEADVNEHLHHGYTFADARTVARAEVANDPASPYKAFGDGLVNGALLGSGDAVRVGAGADPTKIALRREMFSTPRTIGDVTGAVAGTAAMGALAPEALAEGAAAQVFGEGALASAGAVGTGLAAGGAVRGLGEAVDEAALGQTELTAESLLIHGGLGALTELAVGGLLHGVGRGVSALRLRGADAEALQAAATGEAAPAGYGQMRVGLLTKLRSALAERGGANDEFLARAYHPDPAVREDLFAAHLDRAGLRSEAEGALHPALGEAVAAARAAPLEAPPQSLDAVERAFADRAGGPIQRGRVAEFVASNDRPFGDGRMRAMRQLVGELRQGAAGLDSGEVSGEAGTVPAGDVPHAARMSAAADGLEEALGLAGGRVASANALARQLAAEGGAAGGRGLDYLAGAEILMGHPGLGGAAEAAKLGIGAVTKPGQQFIRLMQLKRALGGVADFVSDAANAMVSGATKVARVAEPTLAPGTAAMVEARSAGERRTAFDRRMEELKAISDPGALAERAAQISAHVQGAAPDAAQVMAAKAVSAAQLILQMAPQPLVQPNPLRGPLKSPTIPDSELRTFAEVDAAVQDPQRVLAQIAVGKLPHPKAVQAVQAAYPAWWGSVQAGVVEALTRHQDGVPQARRTAISITFGVDGHPSLSAQSLTLQQAAAQPIAQPPQPRAGGSRGRNPHFYSPKDTIDELRRSSPGKLDRLLVK